MDRPLLFLIKLAWACRYRLPLLITVGFMALDIRMQLEIHVQMRSIRRGPPLPLRGGRHNPSQQDAYQNVIRRNRNNSDDSSSSSWLTVDEDETANDNDDYEEGTRFSENVENAANSDTNPSPKQETYVPILNSCEISQIRNNLLDVNLEN